MIFENEMFDWLFKSRCLGFLVIYVFLIIQREIFEESIENYLYKIGK